MAIYLTPSPSLAPCHHTYHVIYISDPIPISGCSRRRPTSLTPALKTMHIVGSWLSAACGSGPSLLSLLHQASLSTVHTGHTSALLPVPCIPMHSSLSPAHQCTPACPLHTSALLPVPCSSVPVPATLASPLPLHLNSYHNLPPSHPLSFPSTLLPIHAPSPTASSTLISV